MSGFLTKLRTVTLGVSHDLVDKVIDLNSPSVVRQYVRDLESALERLHNEAAIQAGVVRTLTREAGDLQHNIDTETALVSKILAGTAPNKDVISRAKATLIVNWKTELQAKQEAITAQTKASSDIDAAVARLESKHGLMVQQVRDLERIDRDSKTKEHAASALQQVSKLTANGADVSVDDIKSKMMARNDVASEKFDRALGEVQNGNSTEDSAEVDEFLASLQQPQGK